MCACLYITVGLLVFEMAATYSFYLLEISLSVLILSFIVTLAAEQGLNPARWTAYIWEKTREVRPLVVSALAYLAVDLISTFYALSPASVLPKYKVVAVMLLVITIIVYMYEDENGTLKNIHFSVAAAGFFSALLVVLNYCFFAIYPIEYTLRLTLRSDYNMFATTIYIGSVAGSALVCSGNIRPWKKMATIILLVSVTLTVIFLSGSRRIYIAIGPTLAVLTVMCIVYMHRRSIKKRHMFLYVFGTWALCCLIITGAVGLLYSRMVETYRQQGMVGASGVLGHAETSVSQRYETLSNQSLWSKAVLWRIASEEISGYSASEVAFARGNGYTIILMTERTSD
jgi:hypothetical protein